MSIFQLVAGIALAVVAIYLALVILDKLTKDIGKFEEIKKGNVAVAVIIQSGVIGITATIV